MLRTVILLAWLSLAVMAFSVYRAHRNYRKGSVTRAHFVNQIYSVVVLLTLLVGIQLAGFFVKLF